MDGENEMELHDIARPYFAYIIGLSVASVGPLVRYRACCLLLSSQDPSLRSSIEFETLGGEL